MSRPNPIDSLETSRRRASFVGAWLTATIVLFVPVLSSQAQDVVVDFEGETHEATVFAESGVDFESLAGELVVQTSALAYGTPTSNAGGNLSNDWLGTSYLVPATGDIGGFQTADPSLGFRINSLQAWTSRNGGNSFAVGTVTFIGIRHDNSEVAEIVTVTPTGNTGANYHTITFTTIAGTLFRALRVELGSTSGGLALNNIAIDNIDLDVRPLLACAIDPCLNGGSCGAVEGEPVCTCPSGFDGVICELDVENNCDPDPCLNGGVCTDGVGSFTCACQGPFNGPTCADPIIEDMGVPDTGPPDMGPADMGPADMGPADMGPQVDAAPMVDTGLGASSLSGGAGCSAGSGSSPSTGLLSLVLVGVVFVRRRDRVGRRG